MRLAAALNEGEPNILLTNYFTNNSRMMIRREQHAEADRALALIPDKLRAIGRRIARHEDEVPAPSAFRLRGAIGHRLSISVSRRGPAASWRGPCRPRPSASAA